MTNFQGSINIYKTPDFSKRVGYITHFNEVADMVSSKSVTSTNIDMLNLFVLEKWIQPDRPGSFSVFNEIE